MLVIIDGFVIKKETLDSPYSWQLFLGYWPMTKTYAHLLHYK
jgi:hypothetical protein